MKNSMKAFNKALEGTGYIVVLEKYNSKYFPKTYYIYDPQSRTHDWAYKLKDLAETVDTILLMEETV